jgi:hypothetical protein
MTELNTVYARQKLALYPFTEKFAETTLIEEFSTFDEQARNDYLDFILLNRLGPSLLDQLGSHIITKLWSAEQTKGLHDTCRQVAIHYLQQKATILEITTILENHAIPHAIFKGAHTRELVYPKAASRPSSDIDILINENDKEAVISHFASQGFKLYSSAQNLTHQVSLVKGNAAIDLHWHILRPGRVAKTLTGTLLDNRMKYGDHWSLKNEENLFLLLIHPVFTEYSLATQSRLDLMLDLIYWLKTQEIEWEHILKLLKQTSLRTAAWITLSYLHILTGVTIPQNVMDDITPGRLKKWYLRKWIDTDLPAQYRTRPFIAKTGFTLFAHDSFMHSLQFLRILLWDKIRARNP